MINNSLYLRAVGDTIICAPLLVLTHAEAGELIEELTLKALDMTYAALQDKG